MSARAAVLRVLASICLFACASGEARVSTTEADNLFKAAKYEEALPKYEEAVKLAPGRADIHFKLSDTYFALARKALDEQKDEKAYADLLLKAQDQTIAALELDPDNAIGHTKLGILAAYRSDMDAARESFEVARQLDPVNPLHYVNLAEVSVYRGKLSLARRYIEKGRRLGANPAELELDEMLAAWRSGDFIEAQDLFENLIKLNPDVVKTWNGAKDIETFEQFTGKCCDDLTCGPFMKTACAQANQRVTERKLLKDTLAKQIEIEKDRRQRMSKVYDRLRELDIDVEEKDKDPDLDKVPEPDPRQPQGQGQGQGPGQRRTPQRPGQTTRRPGGF